MDARLQAFEERVRDEWGAESTAQAWKRRYESLRRQFGPVTQALIDAADIKQGLDVLDLASGSGEPSISIAKRVAPGGTVTATDLNPGMLEAVAEHARAEGIANLKTQQCDAQNLPFADAGFDRVTSRFGVMFFADTMRALSEARRVLRPGGRATYLVWGPPLPGSYFGTVGLPYIKRLPEPPDPDGPGPMRFAEPDKLAGLLRAAGFSNVEEQRHNLAAPYHGTPELLMEETVDLAVPFQRIMASMPEDVLKEAEAEAYQGMRDLSSDGKISVTAPVVIVTATVS